MSRLRLVSKDGQRKIEGDGARSLRVVNNEEEIEKMSGGSLYNYKKRVYLFHRWIHSEPIITDDENEKEMVTLYNTIDWLKASVDREVAKRTEAVRKAEKEAYEKGCGPRVFGSWHSSPYADSYKNKS